MRVSRATKRAVTLAVAVAGMAVTLGALPSDTPQDGAEGWVLSLSEAERLQWMEPGRLVAMPQEYRRALSRALAAPEAQARFWKNILAGFRSSRALTESQASALASVDNLLEPELFEATADRAAVREAIATARAEIEAVFGTGAADELFRARGAEPGISSALPYGERLRYTWRTARPKSLVVAFGYLMPTLAARHDDCNCADNGDCSYHSNCDYPVACNPWEPWFPGTGCGNWNNEECTNHCNYMEIEG